MLDVRADDSALTWAGVVETEHTPAWSRGWRLPFRNLELFPGDGLRSRAAMQAGVRVVFGTDATSVSGRAVVSDLDEGTVVDLVVDDGYLESALVEADGTFRFRPLPAGAKVVEVWLPQFGDFRLSGFELNDGAAVWAPSLGERPRLVTYGSSITQCRTAVSPTRTWPAIVARDTRLDLTCLGYGGECHLDPMVGRMIRDLPADVIVTCLGINVYGEGTFNERSFLPTVLGMLRTIRDGHHGVPILVISPIFSPDREQVVGKAGMTLRQIREHVEQATRTLAGHGDDHIHLLNGLEVLGREQQHLLVDALHPGADGYAHMAASITPAVRRLLSF